MIDSNVPSVQLSICQDTCFDRAVSTCRYHLFFQNVPDSTEWKFGIVWGHVSSKDMVYWQHHPPALEPGKISPEKEGFFKWDADGCFTGCATITPDGKPTILYTGHLLTWQAYAIVLPIIF